MYSRGSLQWCHWGDWEAIACHVAHKLYMWCAAPFAIQNQKLVAVGLLCLPKLDVSMCDSLPAELSISPRVRHKSEDRYENCERTA